VAEVGAPDMTQAGPAEMTQGSCANVTAAKMHSAEMTAAEMTAAEMTATTEVATTTPVAAAAAGKGVGRETQGAN
jgi:ketosteroid isomerase-like protein